MEKIAELLEQAERPLERALILMQMEQSRTTAALTIVIEKLSANLEQHTNSFAEHRREFAALDTKLDNHIIEEGGMLTWGLRVFSATCGALVLIAGLLGTFIARYILDVNDKQQISIDINSNRLTALETLARKLMEQH
jgi:hypothetical protein